MVQIVRTRARHAVICSSCCARNPPMSVSIDTLVRCYTSDGMLRKYSFRKYATVLECSMLMLMLYVASQRLPRTQCSSNS